MIVYNFGIGSTSEWQADSNTAVWNMSNTLAGGDETGSGGGLTGVDLVLTEQGTLAGASGGYRLFDGTDDGLSWTQAGADALLLNQTAWSIIVKTEDITGAQNNDFWVEIVNVGVGQGIQVYAGITAGGFMTGWIGGNGGAVINGNTGNVFPSTGKLYAVVCSNAGAGSGVKTLCGWTTTKPTKRSDFTAGNVITAAGATLFDSSLALRQGFMCRSSGSFFLPGKLYTIVVSKTCLINLDA